jgi:hypothetical protein
MNRVGPCQRPAVLLTVVLGSGLAGCAGVAPAVHKLPDGSYRIACKDTLSSCLGAFENICDWHGYDVISASERKLRGDLRDVPDVTVTSEAQVRCKPGEPIFGSSPAPAPVVAPAPTPPPPTAELSHRAEPEVLCAAPQTDGGALPCRGTSSGTPAVAPPAPP